MGGRISVCVYEHMHSMCTNIRTISRKTFSMQSCIYLYGFILYYSLYEKLKKGITHLRSYFIFLNGLCASQSNIYPGITNLGIMELAKS